jgi:zinc transporter
MSRPGHILFSYSFDKEGTATKINSSHVAQEAMSSQLCWVHLDYNHKSTAHWLQTKVNYLDSMVIKALLADETRPRLVEFDRGLLIILRGVVQNKNLAREMVSIRLWIDGERIITIQKKPMASILELQQQIEEGLKIENSGQFLHHLTNLTISDISGLIYSLGEKIDEVEDEVIETRNLKFREDNLSARSSLTIYRRHLAPQKEVISKIRSCKYHWVDETSIRHFQENYEHISRSLDEIEEVLMRSKILHDELSHALNEKISRNTFKLSIFTMTFMPLTFLTGVFGMNFKDIPGLEMEYGFHITCIVMLAIAAIQLIFFRKGEWF